MKIKINEQYFFFEDTNDVKKRKELIEDFLATNIETSKGKMSVNEYYFYTWEKQNTKRSLDKISYYLSKMPKQKGKTDKEVMSKEKTMEMQEGFLRTTKYASDLTVEEQESLGLTEEDVTEKPKKRYHVYVKTNAVHYDDMTINEKYNTGLTEVEDSE